MSTQAPTPESDEAARKGAYLTAGEYPETCGKQTVHIEVARNLERERDEARAELEEWKARSQKNICELVNIHAAQAAQIAQLREALERIRAILQSTSHPHEALAITTGALSFPPPPGRPA